MPRFVRPAWVEVSTDGGASRGTGPRSRDGYLSARLTLRTASGDVSDTIRLDAGGHFSDGTGRAELTIPRGFVVSIINADGSETVYAADGIVALTIRPVTA